jgi:hypothetical protein
LPPAKPSNARDGGVIRAMGLSREVPASAPPLFGCTDESPDAELTFVFGWVF